MHDLTMEEVCVVGKLSWNVNSYLELTRAYMPLLHTSNTVTMPLFHTNISHCCTMD